MNDMPVDARSGGLHSGQAGGAVLSRLIFVSRLEKPVEGLDQVFADVEDLLIPGKALDVWERALYYHLLRHTRLLGKPKATFAIAPLSKSVGMSDFKVREVIRALHQKGCIEIEDRSRVGHSVTVRLPLEIDGISRPDSIASSVDLEATDFFNGRTYISALLDREEHRCFYCRKKIAAETSELDHVVPQAVRVDHSYRNVVVSCHGCNKAKGDGDAADYMRRLFRDGLLNEAELSAALSAIVAVGSGERVPRIS